ncbi:hypothetical protein BSPWISOXPB_1298 [uncultured Gammaproteobacteria bacterium]|nr:hypothetical protein BSPWISOXPB_1298 [uncultured Gammaproteobacteria bacterium]
MNRFCSYLWVVVLILVDKQEIFLISFKQAVCGKFALQFSDEFVGNGSQAC